MYNKGEFRQMRAIPLIALFAAWLFSGWAEAQNIADIARKERARQQSVETRIKITNDSVEDVRPTPITAVRRPSQNEPTLIEEVPPAIPQTPIIPFLVVDDPSVPQLLKPAKLSLLQQEVPPLAPPVPPIRDEKWWRTAFQEARNNLKGAEDRVILLEVELSRARLDQLELTSNSQRIRAAAEITRLTKDTDRAQKEAVNARLRVNELEQELQESGGLPAWAR
jgi:hypothetical protein